MPPSVTFSAPDLPDSMVNGGYEEGTVVLLGLMFHNDH